jgi:hypothetical protein
MIFSNSFWSLEFGNNLTRGFKVQFGTFKNVSYFIMCYYCILANTYRRPGVPSAKDLLLSFYNLNVKKYCNYVNKNHSQKELTENEEVCKENQI